MARYAIIDGGKVANIIEADAAFAATIGAIDATGGAIGDLWDGVAFTKAPALSPVVPESVPMLNAQLEMIDAGWWGPVNAFIETLPALDKLKAQTYLNKALTMRRDNYLVLSIPSAIGKTEAEVDALFIAAGARNV